MLFLYLSFMNYNDFSLLVLLYLQANLSFFCCCMWIYPLWLWLCSQFQLCSDINHILQYRMGFKEYFFLFFFKRFHFQKLFEYEFCYFLNFTMAIFFCNNFKNQTFTVAFSFTYGNIKVYMYTQKCVVPYIIFPIISP